MMRRMPFPPLVMKISARLPLIILACSMLSVAAPPLAAAGARKEHMMKKDRTKTVDATCMVTAVEKRENAIIAAFAAFTKAGEAALVARRDSLKTAWVLTAEERTAGVKTAWETYKEEAKATRAALQAGRKAAWKQFKIDAKACKQSPAEEGGGEGIDQQL